MKIKDIKIEGMHNVKIKYYQFDNITYLYGKNGSGKSTILQAIQLCLLGYIPGTNKTSSAIFEHCNCNKLTIELTLLDKDDEIKCIRTFNKTKSKIEEQFNIIPDNYLIDEIIGNLELPIFNFNEFLALSANKQKDLLISILPNSDNSINIYQYLTSLSSYKASLSSILDDILEEKFIVNVNDIKELNIKLKELQSELSVDEKRIVSTIQSLIYYDDYNGETDVDKIKDQIEELTQLRDKVLIHETQQLTVDNIINMYKEYSYLEDDIAEDSNYNLTLIEREDLEKQIAEIKEYLAVYEENINSLKFKLNQNERILSSNGVCPYTQDICYEIQAQFKKFNKQNEDIIIEINKVQEKINESKEKIANLNVKILELDETCKTIENNYYTRDKCKKTIDSFEEFDCAYSSEDLSKQLLQLNDDIIKASSNKKYEELMSHLQKEKLELDDKIAFVKEAIKATGENGLQTELMIKPFEVLANEMNNCLNLFNLDNFGTVYFNLESKANSFKFGLIRNTFTIPFDMISSGEKCIFTLILMLSIIKLSDTTLNTIMIDDLFDHLDDDRFKTITNNIYKLSEDIQVIIAGVNKIEGINVKVIDLSDSYD